MNNYITVKEGRGSMSVSNMQTTRTRKNREQMKKIDIFQDEQPVTDKDIKRLESMGLLVKKEVPIQGGPRAGHTQTNRTAGEVVCQKALYRAFQQAKITQKDARKLLIIEAGRKGGSRNSHVQKLLNLAFFDDKMAVLKKVEKFGDGIAS